MNYELKQFTPGEAAKISGVSVTTQRDWRRRGFLPKTDGHARFDAFEVAEMLVLSCLGQQGIGPSQVRAVLPSLGAGVVGAALRSPRSVSGDVEAIWLEPARLPALLKDIETSRDDPSSRWHPLWEERGYQLRLKILRGAGHEPEKIGDCALIWADGSIAFYGTPISAYETVEPEDRRRAGVVVVVDFVGISEVLLNRAGAILSIHRWTDGDERHGAARQRELIAGALSKAAKADAQ
jgi:DNA-binding transcriptional MerR regulator